MAFLDHPWVMLIVAVLSTPIFLTLARMFWGEKFEDIGETVKFLFWPDVYSLFKGRFWDDWYATKKFDLFLLMCVGWVASVTEILARFVL